MSPRKQLILAPEQLQRMRDTWRAGAPSEFETASAYRRFRMRKSLQPGLAQIARWCAVGVVAGVLVIRISSWVGPRSETAISAEPTQAAPAAVDTAAAREPERAMPVEPVPELLAPVRVTARAAVPAPSALPPAPNVTERVNRDNDDLARAERWLAIGRGKDAEPILTGLERHGATDAIRKRAAELAEKGGGSAQTP